MSEPALLVSVLAFPLAWAVLAMVPRVAPNLLRVGLATFALPAFAAAVTVSPGTSVSYPSLLLGTTFSLGENGQTFLLFTSVLWTLAGVYSVFYTRSDPRFRAYAVYMFLSFAGNAGIFLATDVPFFYTSFTVMTISAYGLVLHSRSRDAVEAGRLYIGMAVFGELLLLSGVIWLSFESGSLRLADAPAAVATSPNRAALMGFLLFGFGVKAGLLPVHGWLPLAHPVAPTPASAVLSGCMIKAGLFGWLVFLPGGMASYPGWGSLCIGLGLTAALAAAYAGFTQTNPKANLAYSSISQMGVMTLGLGLGLADAEAWSVAIGVLAFYALNHAFAKGALFLAVGAAGEADRPSLRGIVLLGAGLAALVIAGLPFTGGSLAKGALKELTAYAPAPWSAPLLDALLLVSSFATTLLLARFVQLVHASMTNHSKLGKQNAPSVGILASWVVSVAACIIVPWVVASFGDSPVTALWPDVTTFFGAWPIAVGIALAFPLLRGITLFPAVVPGDVGRLVLAVSSGIAAWWVRAVAPRMERSIVSVDRLVTWLSPAPDREPSWPDRTDRSLRSLGIAGSLLLLMLVLLWWCLQA